MGQKRETEIEKQRSEQGARTSKLWTEKHKQLHFFWNDYTFPSYRTWNQTTIFFPLFFCPQNNFCSITNYVYSPLTWQVCEEPNGLCCYTLLAENVTIKHCVCPGTALKKGSERRLQRPPKSWTAHRQDFISFKQGSAGNVSHTLAWVPNFIDSIWP